LEQPFPKEHTVAWDLIHAQSVPATSWAANQLAEAAWFPTQSTAWNSTYQVNKRNPPLFPHTNLDELSLYREIHLQEEDLAAEEKPSEIDGLPRETRFAVTTPGMPAFLPCRILPKEQPMERVTRPPAADPPRRRRCTPEEASHLQCIGSAGKVKEHGCSLSADNAYRCEAYRREMKNRSHW
jgi:hypothetical protein